MPLPFERVLHRDPPSAFGARGLAEVVKPGGRMVAVGCSADSAMLLTFRDAMSRQLRVAAPTDAIQVPTAERAQIAALAAQGVDPEGGRFVLQTTARLLGRRRLSG